MKNNLFILAIFAINFSYNTPTSPKLESRSEPEIPVRETIVQELKAIQTIFQSNNPEKISHVFNFPFSTDSFSIYVNNLSYDKQLELNNGKVSKAMFLDFYTEIAEGLQFEQIKNLFENLIIDELASKDEIEVENIIAMEPCYYSYGISIDNNLATLHIKSHSNLEWESPESSEDDLMENDSSICEHQLWWKFKLEGSKLRLMEIIGAG